MLMKEIHWHHISVHFKSEKPKIRKTKKQKRKTTGTVNKK